MQCVVFDMDGVLFDSEALVLRSWEQTAEIHGIPDVREVCLRCLGTNAAESRRLFLEKYGADFPYDTYKAEMSARYWENVGEGKLELKPGVFGIHIPGTKHETCPAAGRAEHRPHDPVHTHDGRPAFRTAHKIGRASCRERV